MGEKNNIPTFARSITNNRYRINKTLVHLLLDSMKKNLIILIAFVASIILVFDKSCCRSKKHDILFYYKMVDQDSLKYEAAKFLLENIKYHFSINSIAGGSTIIFKYVK